MTATATTTTPSRDLKKENVVGSASSLSSLSSMFVSKESYKAIAEEFHAFHRNDMNVGLHFFTTTLGVWGVVQLLMEYHCSHVLYTYMVLMAVTVPYFWTIVVHTLCLVACMYVRVPTLLPSSVLEGLTQAVARYNNTISEYEMNCYIAIGLGYILQDVAHYLCGEKTYFNDYITTRPYMLLVHTLWLYPLVLDSVSMRQWFLPHVVSYNRIVFCAQVASTTELDDLQKWIHDHVQLTAVTTHIWPHRVETKKTTTTEKHTNHNNVGSAVTDRAVTALEHDPQILKGFQTIFPTKHYEIQPIVEMNEIYITAVGAKQEINSDAVFYTSHNDGPYWMFPFCSVYRVLVGITPNQLVRTNFNLQYPSPGIGSQILTKYNALGFDYNRELHYIDHVPNATNDQRRSLVKLHFLVYPKGWKRYGRFVARCNARYNTWARNNFLQTLETETLYDKALAWWIWFTTVGNATFEQHVGWSNVSYVLGAAALGAWWETTAWTSTTFLLATSFRHYLLYMTTFQFRHYDAVAQTSVRTTLETTQSPTMRHVAHGFFIRDALFYKTLALLQLAYYILPTIGKELLVVGEEETTKHILACIVCMMVGYSITILATIQLGVPRTYFGTELGFVEPKFITGFPYNILPHPMIVGQLIVYMNLLYWIGSLLEARIQYVVVGHVACYTIHMIQEILTSSY